MMPDFDQAQVRNLLLRRLPSEAFRLLKPDMAYADLPLKHELVSPGVPNNHVCFVESGLASMLATTSDGEATEVGHIGPEGMAGAHVVLKTDRTPNQTFMQIAGRGIEVPVASLFAMFEAVPEVSTLFLNYVHCTELQLAHSALANSRYNMHERLARWLLMSHDRTSGNDLPLTHEFLALMLGVRRSGVTNELHVIEGLQAIKATRGNIRVRSRQRLEEIAGGCYGVPEDEYERLIGVPLRKSPAAS
jgi:CRP-like cAMP-binding protein